MTATRGGGGANVLASITLGLALIAFVWLARELRDPSRDAMGAIARLRTLELRGTPALVTLTRTQHPRLLALTAAIGDADTTRRVSAIVTIVEGIERDDLVCVAGARRLDAAGDRSVVIRPDTAVFDDGTRTDGELYGEHVSAPAPTTQLRNALVDAALAQRKAIIASASARLLETPDAVEHVRLHAAYAQLDALLLGLMKRIALACASQRTRLGLQYTYKYHGIYGADFVTTAMSL